MGSKRSPPPLGALSEFPPLVESCKPSALLFDEEGIIEYLREVYGFIRLKRFPSDTASFHRDDEARYLGRRVTCVSDVFKVGDVVRFDAVPNPRSQVTARWRVSAFHFVHGVPGWAPSKPCRNWSLDDDNSRELTNCEGVVDRIKSEYGFIRLGPHTTPAAFFRVNVLERSLRTTIKDITQELAVGDLVRFDAELNLKDDTSAKWWVTRIQPVSRTRNSLVDDLGEPSQRPRSIEVVKNSSKDTDEDRSAAVEKASEKRLPWSYARCAAKAASVESVVATSSPKKKAPDIPAATLVSKRTSSVARPSVLIYRGVSGIARSVQGGTVIECEVKEAVGTRRIRLGQYCPFYKDGVRAPEDGGNIEKAVSDGDQLTLDYAVSGDASSKEADVYCHLVWQGERPKDVSNLSLELLSQALTAGRKKNSDTADRDTLKPVESVKNSASSHESTEQRAENCGGDCDCAGHTKEAGASSGQKATDSIVLSEENASKVAEVIAQKLSALLQTNHVQKDQQQQEQQNKQQPKEEKQEPEEPHAQQKERNISTGPGSPALETERPNSSACDDTDQEVTHL